jgi:protein O-mannosyl-transferase
MRISESNQSRLVGISFLLLILFCYWQIYHADFINFDDSLYVTNNEYVKEGLAAKSICWAFSSFDIANWHPITMMSHMLDYQLFGMNASGHHLMNVLFHAGNTLLLFLAFRMMTGALWRSAAIAFLFAMHPLHVESVAWVSERKDVLSTFFMLLSLIAYISYAKKQGGAKYLLAFLLFVLALMSKPMVVTFPFLLMLLDYWPLGRFNGDPLNNYRNPENRKHLWRLIREKIPFLLMSIIISIVTYIAQSQTGAVSSLKTLPLLIRITNSINSYVLYIVHTLFPFNLSIFYPLVSGIPLWQTVCSACFIVLATCLAWRLRQRCPFYPVGWLWYLGSLVPVIGIVQVGMQAMADRYTYIPLIGIFMVLVWLLPDMRRQRKGAVLFEGLALLCVALVLIGSTRNQVGSWANTMSVFSRADAAIDRNILAKLQMAGQYAQMGKQDEARNQFEELLRITPNNITALHNYGIFLINSEHYDEGIKYLREALRLQPTSVTVHNSLAQALWQKGKTEEAEKLLRASLILKPDNPDTHSYLAIVIGSNKERYLESLEQYREAIRIKPNHHRARLGLAITLQLHGQKEEADEQFRQVIQENPYVIAENRFNIGWDLAAQNELEEAIVQYQEGLKILPRNVGAQLFLAYLYQRKGNSNDALKQYREVLKSNPESAAALIGMGTVMADLGKMEDAVHYLTEALRIDPKNASAHNNLGLVAYRQDRMEEAMSHYRIAVKADPRNAEVRYNMGLAFEKMGKINDAIAQLERATEIKPDYVKAKEALARLKKKQLRKYNRP